MTILALFVFKHLPLPKLGSQLLDHMKFSIETSQIMILFFIYLLIGCEEKRKFISFQLLHSRLLQNVRVWADTLKRYGIRP